MKYFYHSICWAILFFFTQSASAQNPLVFTANDVDGTQGSTVNVPITLSDFNNVIGVQGSITWDTLVAQYVTVQNFNPALFGFSIGQIGQPGVGSVPNGALTFSWFNPLTTPTSLPNDAVLFEISFQILGQAGASTLVSPNSNVTPLQYFNQNFITLQGLGVPGTLTSVNTFPVEFLTVNARQIDEASVEVSWETASELNNDYFAVERDRGEGFIEIGRIEGAGTSTDIQRYQFQDNVEGTQRIRYRIRQVDFDGTASYSKVVELLMGSNSTPSMKVYPNPAQDQVFLSPQTGVFQPPLVVRVISLDGKEKMQRRFEDLIFGEIQLGISELDRGNYLIQMIDAVGTRAHQKLLKH